jgi:ribosomal protein L3
MAKLIKSETDPAGYYKRGDSVTFRDNLGYEFPATVWFFYGKTGNRVMISGTVHGQAATLVVMRTMIKKG